MENLIELFGISDDLVPQKFKKGHILQSQGDVNSNAYLVKNGLLRSYTIDQKDFWTKAFGLVYRTL